jgi:hypothetical protein
MYRLGTLAALVFIYWVEVGLTVRRVIRVLRDGYQGRG